MAPPNAHAAGSPLRPDGEAAIARIVERYQTAINDELRAALDQRPVPPFTLMRYHLGWEDKDGNPVEGRGGKLLRPALCLLCCEATGGDWRRALPAAAALELIHNFTLIHDDVEDASRQRHGRETLWSVWGEAQAINAGDGMFALAQATLLRLTERGHPAGRVIEAARMLHEATLRLCEGQHLDLLNEDKRQISHEDYLRMIEGKTAALLAASTGIGALLGGATPETTDALFEFGRRLGLAYQVRDDLLGVWGNVAETGKPAGDDLRAGKQSYPVVVALERASNDQRADLQRLLANDVMSDADVTHACATLEQLGARDEGERVAREHADGAAAALDGLDLDADRLGELRQLARFAADRRA
ncbi:MAG: polyprenyl synthetase family protein [Dehalococcoidia bacterium]